MAYTKTICLLLAIFLSSAIALGQTGDWRAVQHLPGGIPLKIKLKHGHTFGHCDFVRATDDVLHCDYPGFQYVRGQYRRDNVKAVYLVHNARAIGVGIGAGVGAVIGAATTSGSAGGRGFFALIDAGILGGLGYFFGMVADPFFHGKAVYRSPKAPKNANNPSIKNEQSPSEPADHLPCLKDSVTLHCVDP